MRSQLNTICAVAACALFGAGCTTGPGYAPPPERRASEQCPVGETWVCRDHYPSRLERENEVPMICYCDNLQRVR
jgi:hypothetical protein